MAKFGALTKKKQEDIEMTNQKPVRNLDVYATAKEADEAYYLMCHRHNCYSCEYGSRRGNINCAIAWLYAEAGKDAERQVREEAK